MIRVLFIDAEVRAHQTLRAILRTGYSVESAYSGIEALNRIDTIHPDIVLLDIDLPDLDGLNVLRAINDRPDPPPVIMLSSLEDTELVVQAMRAGAADYIRKPYHRDELQEKMQVALAGKLRASRRPTEDESAVLADMVGVSPAVKELRRVLLRYAQDDSAVLILGESGTGKDLAARMVHRLSRRAAEPFVAVNCGAIPEALFESEMFGAEKGAFTGAITRGGSFERAERGTLFLDEIGETSLFSQVKLLRVLEDSSAVRVGGTRKVPIGCRIVAASNRDVRLAARSGQFRQDLLFRIAVLTCEIPPLRERPEDVVLLADHFLKNGDGQRRRFHPSALQKLEQHEWPGNVRELRNAVKRAAVLAEGNEIRARDIRFLW
jgi:DNA-binding NtrC family response regulator